LEQQSADCFEITFLCVKTLRRGWGSSLLQLLEKRHNGKKWVLECERPLVQFYRANGFEVMKEESEEGLVKMEKEFEEKSKRGTLDPLF
jgi:hypothetical protein